MRIVRLVHAKRTVFCLVLLVILSLTTGCGDDHTAPAPPATPEQKERLDKMKDARSKLLPQGKSSFIEKAPPKK